MDISNHTPYKVAWNPGLRADGRNCLIVVIKATYDFPSKPGAPLTLAKEQQDLYETDAFTGEPGYSSPLYENDYASYKPKCDVIIPEPTAYSPHTKAVTELEVALQIGKQRKAFLVKGTRLWEKTGPFAYAPEPKTFHKMALSWEIAYGGTDPSAYEEDELSDSYLANPVGKGYWHKPKAKQAEATALPNTEAIDDPISDPRDRHQPQGFGPIARNWQPRSQYAGTYDEDWEKNHKPFYPADFDERYHQCAPEDQQIDYPQGGETITLSHLTPEGHLTLTLPSLKEPLIVKLSNHQVVELDYHIDTLTLDTKKNQLSMVARAQYPLKNTIHEVVEFVLGTPSEDKAPTESHPQENGDNSDHNSNNNPNKPVNYYGGTP